MLPWLPGSPPQAISHHDLLPHLLSFCLSTVNSSCSTGIAPQSLNSSSQPLPLPGDLVPAQHMYGCGKYSLILIPFRLPQISCFTLSLKCFSSDSDNFLDVGIGPLLQFPKDTGLLPGWRRSCGVGNGNPLQYSCLKNSTDRGAWWATVHGRCVAGGWGGGAGRQSQRIQHD